MVNEILKYKVAYMLHYDHDITVWSLRVFEENMSILTVVDSNDDLSGFPRLGIATIEFLEEPNFDNDLNNMDYKLHLNDDLVYTIKVGRNLRDPVIVEEAEAGQ